MSRAVLFLVVIGCAPAASPTVSLPSPLALPDNSPQAPPKAVNVIFTDPAAGPPKIERIPLPEIENGNAVWGSTGRDHHSNIYFGISCEGLPTSAHLLSLKPNGDVADLGGVTTQLAGQPGSQNKIHTRIVQAADGKLYFASLDEAGENVDGSKLPTFGSHLWRITPGDKEWQHLGHLPEGIVACAAGSKFVYFLGYFGHVLHQFDTVENRITKRIRVGAPGGHTTRNFLADDRGHAYVPRVSKEKSELVEFDEDLKEVKSHPLADYSLTPDDTSHGLVGIAAMESSTWLFTTDRGRLYRLDPRETGSTLTDLGWLHPKGECYAASLFCIDGKTQLCAIGNRVKRGEPVYEWITFDLIRKQSKAEPLKMPVPTGAKNVLVYGSLTRDDAGRCYLGGQFISAEGKAKPALWRLEP